MINSRSPHQRLSARLASESDPRYRIVMPSSLYKFGHREQFEPPTVKTPPEVKVCPALETDGIFTGAAPSMKTPSDVSERVCPSIVISPPGFNVCPPIKNFVAEFSANVELPITSIDGVDVVDDPAAVNVCPEIRRDDISLTVVGFWARESSMKESMRTRNCTSFPYIMGCT